MYVAHVSLAGSGRQSAQETHLVAGTAEKQELQLASLSAKVQAYEEVIKKISFGFGLSDEQLMNGTMATGSSHGLSWHPDITEAIVSRGRRSLEATGSDQNNSIKPSIASLGEADRVEEDFNRDEAARATGFIGKSSEISWLQKLSKDLHLESYVPLDTRPNGVETGPSSPPLTPKTDGLCDTTISSLNYYIDNVDIALPKVDSYELPSRDVANRLFNTYLTSVHPSFPIIGTSTFISQFQLFFSQPSVKPGNKWLAILNLIFAIASRYLHLVRSEWEGSSDDHLGYFARAKVLSMDSQFFDHPDLQQLQVEGLSSMYLLATGQINRSWKLSGIAVRGALALGLHLRNVAIYTSDTSKEIRYRVWWSLYTLDHLLSVMTGRPACIVDNTCTTPLPVPFDETDFQKEEVALLLSNPLRRGAWIQEGTSGGSGRSSPNNNKVDVPVMEVSTASTPDLNIADWLKSLPPSISLYFLHLATLTSVAKRANVKLYSAEAMQSPWASTEFAIQSLTLETDSWLLNLPEPYDFTSMQASQSTMTQRMSLAFLFYGTKISITRPCLCRIEKKADNNYIFEFCTKTAAECVEAAIQMLSLLPDTPDTPLLNKISPWWCILHYFMQATTVLLLELSFQAQHVPDKADVVSQTAKKAIEWLYDISGSNMAAYRAWKLCDDYLCRLAPQAGINVNDLPHDERATATSAASDPSSLMDFAAALDAASSSLIDPPPPVPSPAPIPFTEPNPEPLQLDFLRSEKQQQQLQPSSSIRGNGEDYLPYDPATGQITGSFFPQSTNIDLELEYMWGSPPVI
ncbi:hypothetical protein Egran_04395 [Elaphomyces granulatus]|uniref:Xylanolytic transcriptional activator regulatory domain-containing protein n=1 Tax=Elaphomyces granulatus TaxID=519963 RepID=A0A232LUP4_9EURO|nr:hypothetical protein Egran_04395 [Elaphomyces granulatus]